MFKQEGALVRYGTKLGNLMILQILVVLTSIPIITIGPAMTAMHSVLLDIYRDEETGITKSYFQAFKCNFKQAVVIWLLYLLAFAFLIFDFFVLMNAENVYLQLTAQILPLPLIVLLITLLWVFPLQSRYENTIWNTIKNAFLMSIHKIVPTVAMAIINLVPVAVLVFLPSLMPVVLLLGSTIPGIVCAGMYSKVYDGLEGYSRFKKQEEDTEEAEEV